MTVSQQLSLAAKKGRILLNCISNDVACRSVKVILALCSALVRPHLEHWLWVLGSPVQKRHTPESSEGAMKMVKQLESLSYEKRHGQPREEKSSSILGNKEDFYQ